VSDASTCESLFPTLHFTHASGPSQVASRSDFFKCFGFVGFSRRAKRLPLASRLADAWPYSPGMAWRRGDGYWVSDDKAHLDVDRIHRWLSVESYWAAGRSMEVVRRSLEGSITLGCYSRDGAMVGVCRWVTDSATFVWLCDVFIDTAERGSGLGVFLVGSAMSHPAVQGIRLLCLATHDAHGLYRQFGFGPATGSWMEVRDPSTPPPEESSQIP